MLKQYVSQTMFWLLVISCAALASEEPRLYTGAIEVPTFGPLEMTLGISESEEGTFVLLTVPTQGAEAVPIAATYNQHGNSLHNYYKQGLCLQ